MGQVRTYGRVEKNQDLPNPECARIPAPFSPFKDILVQYFLSFPLEICVSRNCVSRDGPA